MQFFRDHPSLALAERPRGKRTPNGLVWAHDISELYSQPKGVWSRSMIEAIQEKDYFEEKEPEPEPRVLEPWQVLVFPDGSTGHDLASDKESLAADEDKEATIPKLEESIPRKYLPDVLLVDNSRVTNDQGEEQDNQIVRKMKYTRVFPPPDSVKLGPEDVLSGGIDLTSAALLGKGGHSVAYLVEFHLPHPLTTRFSGGKVTVAAKLAFPERTARDMLHHEAEIYNAFPEHLTQAWSGYNYMPEARYHDTELVEVSAVVPKFYGYYVPESKENIWSPILLMEECGTPIRRSQLSRKQRSECFTLPFRLMREKFMQRSLHVENILIQPGPLTKPPSERSMDMPSFRIIDFGRAEYMEFWKKDPEMAKNPERMQERWDKWASLERGAAKDALYGPVQSMTRFAKFYGGRLVSAGEYISWRPYG